MNRGDLVTVSLQVDFGKPRPALVIQADLFRDHSSVTVLPVTGTEESTMMEIERCLAVFLGIAK